MSDFPQNEPHPVPFRRLVRTSSGASPTPPAQRPDQEPGYEYGCVEWYQYPSHASRRNEMTIDLRTRSLRR